MRIQSNFTFIYILIFSLSWCPTSYFDLKIWEGKRDRAWKNLCYRTYSHNIVQQISILVSIITKFVTIKFLHICNLLVKIPVIFLTNELTPNYVCSMLLLVTLFCTISTITASHTSCKKEYSRMFRKKY